MRKLLMLALGPVLALAACGENTGWNPNYSAMNNGSAYAGYLHQREAALKGQAPAPATIPIQLPAKAPTATDLAGLPLVKQPGGAVVRTSGPTRVRAVAPVAVVAAPDLGRYAVQERQEPGTVTYRRTGGSVAAAARGCSGYASADAAQRAFISAGGPILDPRGMDPDGDGFVCGWDPRPLRQTTGL